ncbi:TPA: transcriptional regulator [Enterobacter cloacae]|uniref:winged helix-turn-helix domain-containing protein n=1 Tax=Enterobacter cloacae complex sp. P31C TaxID=2779560 RepID=UPI001D00B99B|nr:winged helix-turn-helix domain-containing protein [Enterobacter cloacae complex sp. P31C]
MCLAALPEAQGEVLCQEQLMEIGWRSAGVEVTDNSVRVMITKLRRAFAQLDLQEAITLIAVTRSGYRLLVREASSELPPPAQTAHLPALEWPRRAARYAGDGAVGQTDATRPNRVHAPNLYQSRAGPLPHPKTGCR